VKTLEAEKVAIFMQKIYADDYDAVQLVN